MFRRILAAVDGSSHAEGVAQAAFQIAERFGAAVHLFRVIELPPDFAAAAANMADSLQPALEKQVRDELTALAAKCSRAVAEEPGISHGRPWRDVIVAAERLDVDLIVIGSHGYGAWEMFLGTTAGKIVDRAERTVLVVKDPHAAVRTTG
jgi:nucleotide-binding universal stress UspA family protein